MRDRPDDIPVLARHFLDRYAERFGLDPLPLGDDLRQRLLAYSWPGNVRELENAIESLVALSPAGSLALSQLPAAIGGTEAHPVLGLKQRVEAYERGLIASALGQARGNRSEAARALGISRVTLHDKLRRYGLARADEKAEE